MILIFILFIYLLLFFFPDLVVVDHLQEVTTIGINRPSVRNCVNTPTAEALLKGNLMMVFFFFFFFFYDPMFSLSLFTKWKIWSYSVNIK